MMYIYLLIILLNTSSALAIYFNKKIEETIFLSIALKIVILFLFGLIINLEIGFYVLLFLNIPLLIYNICSIRKNRKLFKNNLFTAGLFIFLFTYLLFIWINYDRMVTIWDEFSHWALVVKNMFYLDNFGMGNDSTVLAKNYLSGTSLFQYFCMKLNGGFSESILYLGINITAFSLLLPVFRLFKNIKNVAIYILWFVLMVIPTLLYNNFYSSLYVDAILGVTFAYSLYTYYLNYEEGLTKFNTINFALALSMMIFVKDIGIVLALISFFVVLIDNLFIRNKFILNIKKLWDNSSKVFFALIPCVMIKILWLITLSINNIGSSLTAGGGLLSNLLGLLSLDHDGYKYGVIYNFTHALFSDKLFGININISFVLLMGFFVFLTYILSNNIKNRTLQKSYFNLASLIVVGSIGYALLLLLSYLTVFSQYEALNLLSFHRYIGTYALAVILIIIMLFVKKYGSNINKLLKISMINFAIILLFVDLPSLINMTVFTRDSVRNTINIRSTYQNSKGTIEANVNDNERVYFISTDDDGIDFYISRYEITPIKVNLNYAWSIGDPYNEQDIWTIQKTKDEWQNELIKNYDYVYLFDVDPQFIERYQSLFSVSSDIIDDNQLYKINKDSISEKILDLVVVK